MAENDKELHTGEGEMDEVMEQVDEPGEMDEVLEQRVDRSRSRSPSKPPRSPSKSPKRVKDADEHQWIQIPTQTGQKMEYYEQLIKKNKWDADARENLIKERLRTNDKVLIKQAFQSFLDQFPTCTRIWIKWIEYEKEQLDYDELEKIFQKSIRDVPVVELYIHYLEYIQHIHSPLNPTPEEQQEAQETITKAYDYVLNAVGTDKESGQLWMNYIQFVKNSAVSSSYEEQQKMDLLRKIFHKAIHTPIHNIEDIWKEYDAFENNLSKLTAKKFIADRAAGYMTARASIKDQKSLLEPIEYIEKHWVACPPTWSNNQIQLVLIINVVEFMETIYSLGEFESFTFGRQEFVSGKSVVCL
jgi:cleavage stimulation factor subunit 3